MRKTVSPTRSILPVAALLAVAYTLGAFHQDSQAASGADIERIGRLRDCGAISRVECPTPRGWDVVTLEWEPESGGAQVIVGRGVLHALHIPQTYGFPIVFVSIDFGEEFPWNTAQAMLLDISFDQQFSVRTYPFTFPPDGILEVVALVGMDD